MSRFYSGIAHFAVTRTRTMAVAWLLILVAAAFGAGHLEKQLQVGGFSLPGTEFNTTAKVLSDELHISSDKSLVIVYTSPTLKATDKTFADAVESSLARMGKVPYVPRCSRFNTPACPYEATRKTTTPNRKLT